MNIEDIRRLIDLVEGSDVDEIEVTQWFMNRIRVTRRVPRTGLERPPAPPPNPRGPRAISPTVDESGAGENVPEPASPPGPEPEPDPRPAPPAVEPALAASDDRLHTITSPIVGTLYIAPSPGSEPFAQVGDRVAPSTVVCIVEAMKIMNEIEAERAGIVEARLVENGEPVEFGQPLFSVRVS